MMKLVNWFKGSSMGEKHGENIKLHVYFSGIRKKERLEIKTHVEQNLHLVMKIKINKTV